MDTTQVKGWYYGSNKIREPAIQAIYATLKGNRVKDIVLWFEVDDHLTVCNTGFTRDYFNDAWDVFQPIAKRVNKGGGTVVVQFPRRSRFWYDPRVVLLTKAKTFVTHKVQGDPGVGQQLGWHVKTNGVNPMDREGWESGYMPCAIPRRSITAVCSRSSKDGIQSGDGKCSDARAQLATQNASSPTEGLCHHALAQLAHIELAQLAHGPKQPYVHAC